MWAPQRDCWGLNSASVVELICKVELPLAETTALGREASEKMSVGCAWSRVWIVRYCFDIVPRLWDLVEDSLLDFGVSATETRDFCL